MAWFSVVIITKNEEKNIERCLKSIEGLTDDILIVDSFSTDNTKRYCQNYNVRFLEKEFLGYGKTKNWGNAQAKHDYILSLDADEALSSQLHETIRSLTPNHKIAGYSFNRKSSFCGGWIKHCGWYPDRKLRLFDKTRAEWNHAMVHEELVLAPGTTTAFLKGDLLHYTFYSIDQHLGQINKFSSLKAASDHKKGKKGSLLKLIFTPPFKFIKMYFFRLGFLDGWRGYIICRNSAFSTFLRYAKLRQLNDKTIGNEA